MPGYYQSLAQRADRAARAHASRYEQSLLSRRGWFVDDDLRAPSILISIIIVVKEDDKPLGLGQCEPELGILQNPSPLLV